MSEEEEEKRREKKRSIIIRTMHFRMIEIKWFVSVVFDLFQPRMILRFNWCYPLCGFFTHSLGNKILRTVTEKRKKEEEKKKGKKR